MHTDKKSNIQHNIHQNCAFDWIKNQTNDIFNDFNHQNVHQTINEFGATRAYNVTIQEKNLPFCIECKDPLSTFSKNIECTIQEMDSKYEFKANVHIRPQ